MTKTQFSKRSILRGTMLASGVGVLMLGVAGCGGTKVNGNTVGSISSASPASYGLEAYNAVNAGGSNTGFLESSGLASTDGTVAYVTGAVDSTAVPLSSLGASTSPSTGKTTIPLGFAPGGQFTDSNLYGAVPTTTQVVFRAAISNGQSSTATIPIATNGVTLTSPDISGTLTLGFNASATSGPLSNALYISAPFTVPAVTGLHTYTISVADTSGQQTTTTYQVPVVAAADAGVLVQIVDSTGALVAGATATITNPIAGIAQATSDAQGVVILFAKPGTQTITVGSKTTNVVLTAGSLTDSTSSTDSTGKTTVSPLVAPNS